jgi:hypothetical protein
MYHESLLWCKPCQRLLQNISRLPASSQHLKRGRKGAPHKKSCSTSMSLVRYCHTHCCCFIAAVMLLLL